MEKETILFSEFEAMALSMLKDNGIIEFKSICLEVSKWRHNGLKPSSAYFSFYISIAEDEGFQGISPMPNLAVLEAISKYKASLVLAKKQYEIAIDADTTVSKEEQPNANTPDDGC